jgi:NAD-dependent DNA ligase
MNICLNLLLEWRKNNAYEIDGVIVANDEIYPRKSGNPEHAFAFKMVMSDQVAEAKVVDVLWEASKDGYLKPRVRIEPIQLGGVRIEYATGFNGKFIEDNKIGVGTVILMVRSGDVIPYIKSVSVPAEKGKMPSVPYVWNKTHVDILLENPADDITVQEKNVTSFFTHLEVDGLAKGNIKKLFKTGFDTVPKILKMSVADFETVEGFKRKMSEKIYNSIQEKINAASLQDIIVASGKLGRGLGDKKIQIILEAYPDILRTSIEESEKEKLLVSINGIGKENAHEFVKHIPEVIAFLDECGLHDKLNERPIHINDPNVESKNVVKHPLYGKLFVMTKIRDKEIIEFIASVGGILENSMKKILRFSLLKRKKMYPIKRNLQRRTIYRL